MQPWRMAKKGIWVYVADDHGIVDSEETDLRKDKNTLKEERFVEMTVIKKVEGKVFIVENTTVKSSGGKCWIIG